MSMNIMDAFRKVAEKSKEYTDNINVTKTEVKTLTFDGDITGKETFESELDNGLILTFAKISNKTINIDNILKITLYIIASESSAEHVFFKENLIVEDDGSNNGNCIIMLNTSYIDAFSDTYLACVIVSSPEMYIGETLVSKGIYFACNSNDSNSIYTSLLEYTDIKIVDEYMPNSVPNIKTSNIGEFVRVKNVDENNVPIEFETCPYSIADETIDEITNEVINKLSVWEGGSY